MVKERIDILLTNNQIVDSREKAKKYIMAGLIYIDEERIDKPGTKVPIDSNIVVKGNPIPYVSRGGLKLEKALNSFSLQIKDKVALDIGASTGGFTDCMLQNGVRKVYAIDVGYGQLDWKLRNDSRVKVMERTNIRHLDKNKLDEFAGLVSIDVSFISLKLVLPKAKELTSDDVDIIALIKPQFEAGRDKVGKKGVVRDIKVHKSVIKEIFEFCMSIGLNFSGLTYSPVKGAEGNREYLAHIIKDENYEFDIDTHIEKVVNESHEQL
ncbi:MAG: TlyA family RNA methyltransferase [Tissierellales bacterium]